MHRSKRHLLPALGAVGLLAACGSTATPQAYTESLQSALGHLDEENQRHADAVAAASDVEEARAEEADHREVLHAHWDEVDRVLTGLNGCMGDYESMGPHMGAMHDGRSYMEAMHADMEVLHDRLHEVDGLLAHHEEVWAQAQDLPAIRSEETEHHHQMGLLLDEMAAAARDLDTGDPDWQGWDCGHMATEGHHASGDDHHAWGEHSGGGMMGGWAH